MMNYSNIYPSIICANFADLRKDLENIIEKNCGGIHFDVMDGIFVPQITIGNLFIESCIKYLHTVNFNGTIDVHLMVEKPERIIDDYCIDGVDAISFHLESTINGVELCEKIRKFGIKVGIAIKPDTNIDILIECLKNNLIDFILIMSVEPGYSGQKFIENTWNKIEKIQKLLQFFALQDQITLHIDGGITFELKEKLEEKGIQKFVIGSAFFAK